MSNSVKKSDFFFKSGVNMKTTGPVPILDARTGRILVHNIWIVTKTRTGSGTGATANFGTDSPDYKNIVGGDNLSAGGSANTNLTAVGGANFPKRLTPEPTGEYTSLADLATNGLRINITAASTYTTETADIVVEATIF
jgi:hypothetical protein